MEGAWMDPVQGCGGQVMSKRNPVIRPSAQSLMIMFFYCDGRLLLKSFQFYDLTYCIACSKYL